MKEWFTLASEQAIVVIDLLALMVIVFGALEAFITSVRAGFLRLTGHERRATWLRFARWLVAGLTFQLAADIIESSITTSWESVARLGAIAVIRTFLNYFLERDVADARELQHAPESAGRSEAGDVNAP